MRSQFPRALRTAALAVAVGAAGAASPLLTAAPAKDAPREIPSLPDRLSSDPKSPHYDRHLLRLVGVRFNGEDRPKDVIEYDRIAGWIVIHIFDIGGKPIRNQDGTWMSEKHFGKVEPYWRAMPSVPYVPTSVVPAEHFKNAAEEKRARKAAKLKALAEKGAIAAVKAEEPVAEKAAPKKPRIRKAAPKKVMTA